MEEVDDGNGNLLGAMMSGNDVYGEVIGDGIDVCLGGMKIVLENKGKDKGLVVSDGIEGSGLKDGGYMVGSLGFNVKDGIGGIDSGNVGGSRRSVLKEVGGVILELDENGIEGVNMG